jgi:hypothetical protein
MVLLCCSRFVVIKRPRGRRTFTTVTISNISPPSPQIIIRKLLSLVLLRKEKMLFLASKLVLRPLQRQVACVATRSAYVALPVRRFSSESVIVADDDAEAAAEGTDAGGKPMRHKSAVGRAYHEMLHRSRGVRT